MTAKEYLLQYKNLDTCISAKSEQLERFKELATKVSPSQGNGGSGDVSDRVGATVAKICDAEAEINDMINQLVDLKREIENAIAKVPDATHRQILELRYLNQKKWENIAVELHTDLRWIYRLHGRALQQLTIESDYKPVV